MARIDRTEHSRILHLVDVEHRRVTEVAAEYGCTSANIYVLLGKLRREAGAARPVPEGRATASGPVIPLSSGNPAVPAEAPPPEPEPASDLFAAPPMPPAIGIREPDRTVPAFPAAQASAPSPAVPFPFRPEPDRAGIGARLARPGFGLAIRDVDGDETMAPFRSLDDLLSAIKPILRDAARGPDPVWFSIQPVDLAEFEDA